MPVIAHTFDHSVNPERSHLRTEFHRHRYHRTWQDRDRKSGDA
jgi:hypothetical protein